MSLLSMNQVSFTWSGHPLLDEISLEIYEGERIGLLGRNGAGKSTLMKMIAGELDPDDGQIKRDKDVRIARLIQEVPTGCSDRIHDFVTEAATPFFEHEWEAEHAVERILSRMELNGETRFDALSSGMKRRVLLAASIVQSPDILLLDEPTNHLDIPAIKWLEQFLQSYNGTLLFVTHDRVFLQALATRIIEIDRGKIYDWTCDYDTFLKRKEAFLDAEEKQNALFDKKLAEEEVWIRQGIKARRTRNEGRVRALKKMREERRQRQSRVGNVNMQVATADRSGQLVIEAKNVTFSYGDEPVIQNLSTLISRGDKIGIIGRNGAGKTTLLKLLLGELKPDTGSIRQGTNLEILYFDQLREQIEEEKTVIENVGEGQQTLTINGQPRNIYGYLQDFLFSPERARRPARYLSGGERNRLLLAKLFTKPTNLMVLDEPTNDLDAETLELLEELICNHPGTLLLVSHDRAFLNNVVTATLVFEEGGEVKEYVGGYDDYLLQSQKDEQAANEKKESQVKAEPQIEKPKVVKLSFKEERELKEIPQNIEQLEQEQVELQEKMASPEFFKQSAEVIADATSRLSAIQQDLEHLLERWEELESRVS
ncbi:ATP-binding cassette domain-containing protein [Gimesia maris]|uniref:ATP-binding protein Uup n=1 Tax=Gimesia maris TaxID=122 RepID=A0ABX5YPB2_9PLAN|nr:ATP-binding cassette domain-containing protein [Gimesia maris]EDL57864.1 ABC transporter, ATP-binding protein [Gimesia maris DSM 8797]QEG17438.1 ABC transporter ATP-binding protein uup [Gimesia maris]QGQ29490.1 ATP-binding cassette domain-containing protein [Gimesia maris]